MATDYMKKPAKLDPLAERPSLDFSKGVRGKYSNLLKEGTNVVVLDPTLLAEFPDSQSVNDALRAFLSLSEQERSEAFKRRHRQGAGQNIAGYDPRTGTIIDEVSTR